MILHPGILALLLASVIILLMLVYAALLGIRILRRWDYTSSSAGQLTLERQTYLVSTLVFYAFGFVMLSGFLYLYTVDEIHGLFIGAMCAVGSLNANPVGWQVLAGKILGFFLAAVWMAINFIDQRGEDYPLVRGKYLFLLLIVPVVAFDLYVQGRYFLGLQPEIITSCCGSLFTDQAADVAGELAGLPVRPMMWLFYLTLLLHAGAGLLCLRTGAAWSRYLFAGLTLAFFLVAMAAIISYISLYIYELPTHHCPFDILQKEYHFIGYPMYITLFTGTAFGLFPAVLQPARKFASIAGEIRQAERKWVTLSITTLMAFALISSWPVWFGNLTMQGSF
jgi:hypothetical protein